MLIRSTIAVALLIACNSCLCKQAHTTAPIPTDLATARRAIEEANQAFIVALKRSDMKAITDAFEPDAILLPAGMDMLQGRDTIATFFSTFLAHSAIVETTSVTVDLRLAGDTAYETGLYTMTTRTGAAAPVADHGKYLVVWRHDGDDRWRVAREISNTSVTAGNATSAAPKPEGGSQR